MAYGGMGAAGCKKAEVIMEALELEDSSRTYALHVAALAPVERR